MPMGHFGKTPFGDNLYRIVYAQSRRHLVGGRWVDGELGYHWVEKYPQIQAAWILERWHSAMEYTGCSQTQWDSTYVDPNSGWLLLGPYPSRGEYDMVWQFEQGVDADSLDKIIAAINHGRTRSYEEIRRWHKADYEKDQLSVKNASRDEICDVITAFGNAPMSSARVSRGTKTAAILRSAEELGLPTPAAPRRPARGPLQISSTLLAGGGRPQQPGA